MLLVEICCQIQRNTLTSDRQVSPHDQIVAETVEGESTTFNTLKQWIQQMLKNRASILKIVQPLLYHDSWKWPLEAFSRHILCVFYSILGTCLQLTGDGFGNRYLVDVLYSLCCTQHAALGSFCVCISFGVNRRNRIKCNLNILCQLSTRQQQAFSESHSSEMCAALATLDVVCEDEPERAAVSTPGGCEGRGSCFLSARMELEHDAATSSK